MMLKLFLSGLVLLFSCYTNQPYCKNDENGNNSMRSVEKHQKISAENLNKSLPVFYNNHCCDTYLDPLKVTSEFISQHESVYIPGFRTDCEFSESNGMFLTQFPHQSGIRDVSPGVVELMSESLGVADKFVRENGIEFSCPTQDHKHPVNKPFEPDDYKIITSDRADGRYVSTRGFVQYLIRNQQPQLAFDPQFSKQEFLEWQKKVREKMQELMKFPDVTPQPLPKFLSRVKRDGYRVEKWEFYPQSGSVVPFLMLIPDDVSAENPAPVALCLPGSTSSKERLAGEEELDPVFAENKFNDENKMAKLYAQEGIIAVAVDNPGIAETSDLEKYTGKRIYDRATFTRYLIDMDWHYMGFSAFQSHQLLKWLRTLDFIDPKRIVLSGHSLGTVAAMYLAVLNQDVYAVVYNQCITRLIDYAKVRTKPDSNGRRPESSWLGHSVPGMWKWFDYPDILASLSPRPVIFSEGATLSDIELIKRAYHIMGADDNLAVYHYPMYKDCRNRKHDYEIIPEGLDHKEFWEYYNIDGDNHYFKADVVVPWLKDVLKLNKY